MYWAEDENECDLSYPVDDMEQVNDQVRRPHRDFVEFLRGVHHRQLKERRRRRAGGRVASTGASTTLDMTSS